MKDFTPEESKVEFTIKPDTFYGVDELPGFAVIEFSEMISNNNMTDPSQLEVSQMRVMFTKLIELTLQPDSAKLFLDRLSGKGTPIGIKTIKSLIPWLMEQYGLRPTKPSEKSSDGPENQESGTNSMENTSEEE